MSTETLNLTPRLYAYLHKWSLHEPVVLKQLRQETAQLKDSQMQISPEQGQFMTLLVKMLDASKTLDIGVFTGYSSLAVALALPANGRVVACDVNAEWTTIAQRYWHMAGVADKIDLHLAPAADTLQKLIEGGEGDSFDFAFIDADKQNYSVYYELSLELLRSGGVVAIDNVLWGGRVADPREKDTSTLAIREINELIYHDRRVEMSMLPIGDGLTLARKK